VVTPGRVCLVLTRGQGLAVEIARVRGRSTRAAVACLHLHYVPDNTGPPNAFNSGMNLTTSRLILRPWREADLSPFAHLNDDRVVMEFCRGAQPTPTGP
jgi:hypothetical protein